MDIPQTPLSPLNQFSIDWNNISYSPDTITMFRDLIYLGLTGNPIPILPENIGRLSKLETVWLNYVPLRELPQSFFYLTALKDLILVSGYVSNQDFERICLSMPNLTFLIIGDTNITSIPSQIASLKKLEDLWL